jgi:hypothetical protein
MLIVVMAKPCAHNTNEQLIISVLTSVWAACCQQARRHLGRLTTNFDRPQTYQTDMVLQTSATTNFDRPQTYQTDMVLQASENRAMCKLVV